MTLRDAVKHLTQVVTFWDDDDLIYRTGRLAEIQSDTRTVTVTLPSGAEYQTPMDGVRAGDIEEQEIGDDVFPFPS